MTGKKKGSNQERIVMSKLDEQIDDVVMAIWKISEPYPTYNERATKLIKSLITNEVEKAQNEADERIRQARIEELEQLRIKALSKTPAGGFPYGYVLGERLKQLKRG